MTGRNGFAPRRVAFRFSLLLVLHTAGCATPPYQPALLYLPGTEGPGVLRACLPPLRPLFPRIQELGEHGLLSEWVTTEAEETAERRRLEILVEPLQGGTLLSIAVKRIRIGASVRGGPAWVSKGGDRAWEEKVLELLQGELGGRRITPREVPERRLAPPVSD